MQHIKPIETRYKGFRFRSRLEARWAVFFDELGLKWEYEPEGFDLGNGTRYLPDFRITAPTGRIQWYEVKPPGVGSDEKLELFGKLLRPEGYVNEPGADLLSGDPLTVFFEQGDKQRLWLCPRCGNCSHSRPEYPRGTVDVHFYCNPCDWDTPSGGGNPIEPGVLAPSEPYKGALIVDWQAWGVMIHKIKAAATAARSARFEHGESGARA